MNGPFQRVGGAPPPGASRVEAIRDAIDLGDPTLPAAYGERARREVLTLIERLLAETRAGDLGECVTLLAHVEDRLRTLHPSALRTRGGLAGWFDSRQRRLQGFRETFVTAAEAMSETAGAMIDPASGVARRSQALERLWVDTRAAISELDAYVAAGMQRLKEDPLGAPSHPLVDRLAALASMRNAAVRQLPLVRLAQNADCRVPERLAAVGAAVSDWRDEWREALGLHRKRPKKIVPDQAWLTRERDVLAALLDGVRRDLTQAGSRRAQAAARMERVAESVRRAIPRATEATSGGGGAGGPVDDLGVQVARGDV